jgi:hypothetical protein
MAQRVVLRNIQLVHNPVGMAQMAESTPHEDILIGATRIVGPI